MFDIRQTVPQQEVKAAYGFFCIPKSLRHVILGETVAFSLQRQS
jgi:hypothetical protein